MKVVVKVEAFYDVEVTVDEEKKEAFAKEMDTPYPFCAWGVVGEDNKLYSNSNDISTNYLEIAMIKAFQHLGIMVIDRKPYPLDRKIEVVSA